jgi:hypothetical protein
MLLAVIGVGCFLTLIRLAIPRSLSSSSATIKPNSLKRDNSIASNVKTDRSIVLAKTFFEPKVVRSEHNHMPLVDMNDRGDFLFLAAPANDFNREYIHLFNKKVVRSGQVPKDSRWLLTSGGNILKRRAPGRFAPFLFGRTGNGIALGNWPYNDIRFISRFEDDGSVIGIRYISDKHRPIYSLQRDYVDGTSQVLYQSPLPTEILDKDDDGDIWIRQAISQKNTRDDNLLKFHNGKMELLKMPAGYSAVNRVAKTGKYLVCTFGNILSTKPFRAYSKTDQGWHELPIPEGYVYSFAQKIFNDGLILGFVTDANREAMKPIAWDGDRIAFLDETLAWPKLGKYSFVSNATRRGDVLVRSVLNTESGAYENYLIHISRR